MTSSDSPNPAAAAPPDHAGVAQDEAQRAADGLKEQIAAVRDRIRKAREALTAQTLRDTDGQSDKR